MKFSKRLFTIMLSLVLCLSSNVFTAFATEATAPVDYVVASATEENVAIAPYSNNYNSVWVPAGVTSGSFRIEKTFNGTGNITFKARSDKTSTSVNMCLSMFNKESTMSITGWVTVPATDTDIRPTETCESQYNYYVHYKFPNGNPNGTFLMCWIYG